MIRLLQGDCREVMATLDEASVDAIVTDPPYGLEFMGKEWDTFKTGRAANYSKGGSLDPENIAARSGKGGAGPTYVNRPAKRCAKCGKQAWSGSPCKCEAPEWVMDASPLHAFQAWSETWAREALRVLKPGGHLLAFSGTRTYHRMVCAIEDAGFEIRDQLQWVFASGFPKSLNLDNERGRLTCACDDPMHGLRQVANDAAIGAGEGEDAELQPPMQRRASRAGVGDARVERCHRTQDLYADVRPEESGMEGRRDAVQEEGELRERAVCPSAGMGASDGEEGRIRHGAPADDGRVVRLPADADGSRASRQSRPDGQRADESGTMAGQPEPQARGAWPVCGGCSKPILPRGLGTALKPANEPIVLARKPLVGTVAANVLKHGTGALNIDGCRVGVDAGDKGGWRPNCYGKDYRYDNDGAFLADVANGSIAEKNPLGRWPANIIHDGSEEVIAAFPQTSGSRAAGEYVVAAGQGRYGAFRKGPMPAIEGDSGSAARFFYTAKASRYDRNDGLDGMPEKPLLWSSGEQSPGTFQSPNTKRAARNNHPTVKPTDLMRYLCRLVTPPGGVVLDPFAGSGSTLKAAELEGFSAIGIELDPAYVEIARRRIASDAPLFAEVAAE